jgi:hypothetical protein
VTHIDEWLDTPTFDKAECYAKFVIEYFRRPAWQKLAFATWMQQHRLFCTYEGMRYRCIGASRMGDVWLTADFDRENGYDKRVDVAACSEWSAQAASGVDAGAAGAQPSDAAK